MRTGFGQLICLIVGIFLLSFGSGLAGARWAIHKYEREALEQAPRKSAAKPASLDETRLPSLDEPAAPATDQSSPALPEQIPDPLPGPAAAPSMMTAEPKNEPQTPSSQNAFSPGAPSKLVIQAISTSKRQEAMTARNTFIDQGLPAGIFEVDLGEKGKWYRVYIGPYDSEEEARAALESVRQIPGFKASFVKSLD
jgi:cell division protein FtsN